MEVYSAKPDSINVGEDRARKEFKRQPMLQLIASIKRYGQLQPGVCVSGEDGTICLVAGERRLRACKENGIEFQYVLKEDLSFENEDEAMILMEIELEENIARAELDYQEILDRKCMLHELKQARYGRATSGARGGWGIGDTAEALGESKGLLSEDLQLAYAMRELPELRNAKTKTEAKKILKRIMTTVKRSDELEAAKATAQTAAPSSALTEESAKEIEKPVTSNHLTNLQTRLLEFDKRVLQGDMVNRAEVFKDGSVDICLFDPPWAVGFDQVRLRTGTTKDYSDDIQENLANLPGWLELIYRKMSPNSHLYMFFGIVNHELVYNTLEAVGFVTNRMPLFWHKQGAHRVRTPLVWPGRCYEAIAYARKGSKDLALQGQPDIITTKPPTSKMKREHPSAKNPTIYLDLIRRSAQPGDVVLDPMCGSGMSLVACEALTDELQLDWWGIELDKDFRELAIFNLAQGQKMVELDSAEHEARLKPSDITVVDHYTKCKVGSDDWKAYWKAHPEQQEEMLDWKNTQQ